MPQDPRDQFAAAGQDFVGLFLRKAQLSEREKELNVAGNGFAMILFAFIFFIMTGPANRTVARMIDPYKPYVLLGLVGMFIWGLYWLYIGSVRSQGPRDVRLSVRAALKIALGIGCLVVAKPISDMIGFFPIDAFVIFCFGFWLILSNGLKLALLQRGMPKHTLGTTNPMPHGDARFSGGGSLQGGRPDMPHGDARFSGGGSLRGRGSVPESGRRGPWG
jgi:hypothetical protein